MHRFKSIFSKKKSSLGIVALSFSADGIAIAISHYTGKKNTSLTHCEFIASNKKQSVLEVLTAKYNLEKYDCYLVLASEDYRLISLEAPQVADDEMVEAVRWKISEFVDFPVDEAFIDFYDMPASTRANSVRMIEVVATAGATVQPLVDLCLSCKLNLQVITIQEITLKNLAALLPDNERAVALLHLQKTTGNILILQQNTIYLNRKIASGYDRLGLNDITLTEEQIAFEQSGLALEIQRSIDHVDSTFNLLTSSDIAVLPLPENTQGLLNFLNNNYGIAARVMDLSTILEGDFVFLNDFTQSLCAAVAGATLINDTESDL